MSYYLSYKKCAFILCFIPVSGNDLVKTILLAVLSAAISFGVTLLLRYLYRRRKKRF